MNNKKAFYKVMINRTVFVAAVFGYGLFLCNGTKFFKNSVTNMNSVKSISAVNMISKYSPKDEEVKVIPVSTMEEAAEYGPNSPISFTGEMTAYNAVCKGCTGKVACPPRQDVRNGNVWYKDSTYGNVRILAADPKIPCGTIVKFSNVTFSNEPVIGIVLDRGGAIKGNIMDFLVSETDDMDIVGRQKEVNYEVVRWGW